LRFSCNPSLWLRNLGSVELNVNKFTTVNDQKPISTK